MRYLCTFGSGWDKAIEKIFKREFPDYFIEKLSDGIIIFNTEKVVDIKKCFSLIMFISY